MTPIKASELLRLAGRATPGPWVFMGNEDTGGVRFVMAPGTKIRNGCNFIPADCSHAINGEYIAAANPDTIRALIAGLKVADKALDKIMREDVFRLDSYVTAEEARAELRRYVDLEG